MSKVLVITNISISNYDPSLMDCFKQNILDPLHADLYLYVDIPIALKRLQKPTSSLQNDAFQSQTIKTMDIQNTTIYSDHFCKYAKYIQYYNIHDTTQKSSDMKNTSMQNGEINLLQYLTNLIKNKNDYADNYDRFVIINYNNYLSHPKLKFLNENCIWISDGHSIVNKTILHDLLLQNKIQHIIFSKKHITLLTNNAHNNCNDISIAETINSLCNFSHLIKTLPENINNNITIRKNYNIQTPKPLNTLEPIIINAFTEDLNFNNIHNFLNGVNSTSYNQVPDMCKKFMKYENNNFELQWSKEMIDAMLQSCSNLDFDKLSPNDYPRAALQFVTAFQKFVNVSDKKCLVLGSISPWIECLLLYFNAGSVTTLDYNVPKCDYKIKVLSMTDYNALSDVENKYDVIISYSSLEHDGLGRYGDPINPNGDIDACIEAYTMLNPGGYFLCGIPIGNGIIEGNWHRIYNSQRIQKMFCLFDQFVGSVNYSTLDETLNYSGNDWQNQPIFIYTK